jgi:hypothetical protein
MRLRDFNSDAKATLSYRRIVIHQYGRRAIFYWLTFLSDTSSEMFLASCPHRNGCSCLTAKFDENDHIKAADVH